MSRFIALALGSVLPCVPLPQDDAIREMTPDQETSIEKGIDWMLKNQNADGLWGCEKSGAPSTAITALGILALLASDSTYTRGRYSEAIRKAVDKLIAIQSKNGQITRFDSTGMGIYYDHSCATLALAEVYGTRGDREDLDEVRAALESAAEFIYSIQNEDGGWSAQGSGGASDLAITCNVWMALRATHNAGITIRDANMAKVETFVKNCALPNGGFTMQPNVSGGGGHMFYPTSAGLRILYGLGRGDAEQIEKGSAALLKMKLGQDYGGKISEWDYCGAFYAVQAMMHEGDKFWRKWWPGFRDRLVKIQNEDGSWTIEYCLCCRAYATALSLLVLQAPKRLLPLFQL